MNEKQLCYICSPVNYYFQILPKDLAEKKCIEVASNYVRFIYNFKNILPNRPISIYPISAPLSHIPAFDDTNSEEREYCLFSGFALLMSCGYIFVNIDDLKISSGIRDELKYATNKMKIPVILYEKGLFKVLHYDENNPNSEDSKIYEEFRKSLDKEVEKSYYEMLKELALKQ